MGPTRLKGINEPIVVHEVIGLGRLRSNLEKSVGRGILKFVGRSREKAVFQDAAERTRSGEGQIVALVADLAKSRLFHEFKTVASASWTVTEAFSVSHGKGWPFVPVIEMLHAYFGIGGDDAPTLRRDRVAAKLHELDPALETALPFIGSLLEFGNDNERLAGMNPQLRRTRIVEAVVDLLVAQAKKHRLMLIVEDLQWLRAESSSRARPSHRTPPNGTVAAAGDFGWNMRFAGTMLIYDSCASTRSTKVTPRRCFRRCWVRRQTCSRSSS